MTTLATIQLWALKAAKAEGVKEERARVMSEQIDSVHKKIREDVMPRILELEKARREDAVRSENMAAVLTEVKEDGKKLLELVQDLALKVAGISQTPRTRKSQP